jgi:hypothetical protein
MASASKRSGFQIADQGCARHSPAQLALAVPIRQLEPVPAGLLVLRLAFGSRVAVRNLRSPKLVLPKVKQSHSGIWCQRK